MTTEQDEDPFVSVYRLRWYFRYPIGIATLALGAWLAYSAPQREEEWLWYGMAICAALYGLFAARELGLVVAGLVALLLLYVAYQWLTDKMGYASTDQKWAVAGVIVAVVSVIHAISSLEAQVKEMRAELASLRSELRDQGEATRRSIYNEISLLDRD